MSSSSKKCPDHLGPSARRPSRRLEPIPIEALLVDAPLEGKRRKTLDESVMEASRNAAYYEWDWFRGACLKLAQRRMTLAETGARLLKTCSQLPGVLNGGDEAFPFSSFAGVSGSSRVTPDLPPLPVPSLPTVSASELDAFFPEDSPPTAEGFKYGAQSWLHLVIYALNQMYTGSAQPAKGPPTEAQSRAISLPYEDCGELCRDVKSRSPNEWPAAYKSKLNAYWGGARLRGDSLDVAAGPSDITSARCSGKRRYNEDPHRHDQRTACRSRELAPA